jgi:toxin secretion/phage lysis holin
MMNKIKTFFTTTVFGAIYSLFGILAIPMVVLAISNVLDWLTGIMAAKKRGEAITSKLAIFGVFKKVCQWILVFVGFLFDQIISYSVTNFSLEYPFKYLFATLVAVWLILCEFISILENINDIGQPLPVFLMNAIKWLKNNVESKSNLSEQK